MSIVCNACLMIVLVFHQAASVIWAGLSALLTIMSWTNSRVDRARLGAICFGVRGGGAALVCRIQVNVKSAKSRDSFILRITETCNKDFRNH